MKKLENFSNCLNVLKNADFDLADNNDIYRIGVIGQFNLTIELAWKALQEIKAGKVEYRLDKTNIIHTPIGKKSFGTEKLTDNLNALLEAVAKAKPAAAKGQYMRSVTVASTMGPGVKINPARITF